MKRCLVALLLLVPLLIPVDAVAHGIWGHVHVTGWAIENLPEGELQEFFSEPEVMHAALFGAAFTDSGYWPQGGELAQRSRAYSEHTHWEPFIQDFVAWIVQNDPPPWDSLASRQRVAFLMGVASHGLQDEIFDSLFLYQIQHHDGAGQEEADPGTDGFLALDGHIRFQPTSAFLPYETLLELYEGLGAGVDRDTIERSVRVMELVYLDHANGLGVARTLGEQYKDVIPWARAHYLDPDVPGSLVAEVEPTGRYMEAIWGRLHGRTAGADPVVFAYPATPRRLRSHDASLPDSWVTFIFAAGVRYDAAVPTWVDREDEPVMFAPRNTRWGGTWPRLIRLLPEANLEPGGWYTAGLGEGVELIDGSEAVAFSHEFQVACEEGDPDDCEDLGELYVPDIGEPNPPDAGLDAAPDTDTDPDSGPDNDMGRDARDPPLDGADDVSSPDTPDPAPPTASSVKGGSCEVAADGVNWSLRRR